jgi:hypothetical protein
MKNLRITTAEGSTLLKSLPGTDARKEDFLIHFFLSILFSKNFPVAAEKPIAPKNFSGVEEEGSRRSLVLCFSLRDFPAYSALD